MITKLKALLGKKSKSSQSSAFPQETLKMWLKNRKEWDHFDWLNLLEDLRNSGYSVYTDSEDGRTMIGQFLESERDKI
ncbi:MAG: hypothetical protein M1561_03530 [Gammaproteobacteria bacterium]|nr:hypothetical protein [Gammaproteobacteria bacterium]